MTARRRLPGPGVDIGQQPHMMRTSSAHQDDNVTRSRSWAGQRRPHEAGQVAIEWLMVAGILTAVAIMLTGMFKPVLVDMVRLLARSVRTVGL